MSRLSMPMAALAVAALWSGQGLAAPPAAGSTYVAVGSSYAAGTSLPRLADDSPPRCGQGTDSYPRQVARALQLKLVDRSCGGAVAAHLLKGGQFDQPAQLAAVDADTRLVTITIGGNDVRFVADLGRYSCHHQQEAAAQAARPAACAETPAGFNLEAAFAQLDQDLHAVVAEIRRRSPQARIVFVDYVTVLPPNGACAALGFGPDEAAEMRQRAVRLAALTAKVAGETRADLVQASHVTQGHDVCSAQPWAAGFLSEAERQAAKTVAFHPRLEGTTVVAQAIVEQLRK